MKILSVVGARPNFVKIAPIIKELDRRSIENLLLHTGQHSSFEMSDIFFDELELKAPDIKLQIKAKNTTERIGEIIIGLSQVLSKEKPDLLIVVGDVDSTFAAAVTAAKMNIPIAHIEAGLRSFDNNMPEEFNRIYTDKFSRLLFTHSEDADKNLLKEGIEKSRIFRVGNVMIDSLFANFERAKERAMPASLGLNCPFGLVTLHRPSNVDHQQTLKGLIEALIEISTKIKLVFVLHPRTSNKLKQFDLLKNLQSADNILLSKPLGYLDFLSLSQASSLILTDSGGLQEESTALLIDCLTLRNNTDRPVTVSHGTNLIVGTKPENIIAKANQVLEKTDSHKKKPVLWDGLAAVRILDVIEDYLNSGIKSN